MIEEVLLWSNNCWGCGVVRTSLIKIRGAVFLARPVPPKVSFLFKTWGIANSLLLVDWCFFLLSLKRKNKNYFIIHKNHNSWDFFGKNYLIIQLFFFWIFVFFVLFVHLFGFKNTSSSSIKKKKNVLLFLFFWFHQLSFLFFVCLCLITKILSSFWSRIL